MSTKINSYVFMLEVYTYSIVVSAEMPNLVWIPWVMCRNGGKNSKFFTKSFNAERNAKKSIPSSQILAVWKSAGSKKISSYDRKQCYFTRIAIKGKA